MSLKLTLSIRPFSYAQISMMEKLRRASVCESTKESVKERRNGIGWNKSEGYTGTAAQRAKLARRNGGSSGRVWAREVGPCVQCQVARILAWSSASSCFARSAFRAPNTPLETTANNLILLLLMLNACARVARNFCRDSSFTETQNRVSRRIRWRFLRGAGNQTKREARTERMPGESKYTKTIERKYLRLWNDCTCWRTEKDVDDSVDGKTEKILDIERKRASMGTKRAASGTR